MNKRKHLKLSILVITIILGITVVCSSCLSIITRGLISAFSSATDALSSDTTWTENTNITNNIAVTFKNDVMLATWDYNSNCNYTLKINDGSQDKTIDSTDESYTNGEIDLSSLGYTYEDTLSLQMYKTNSTNQTASYKYTYNGLSKYDYNKYTQKVSAGFEEIDYYIATREELFDLWSYLIIYRDGAKYDSKEGGYTLDKEIYMAYNYKSLYSDATQSDAYKFEIYSALAAFEDSCAYGYGYEMNSDGVHGEISICLYSSENPQYTTTTNQKYKNVYSQNDYYTLNRRPLFLDQYDESRTVASRTYAIDSITKTVTVKTSDQLYYAIKMGYKPNCVKNSNAELLYNRMKEILAYCIQDSNTPEEKVLYLYEYIVCTVIYDYEFCDTICEDESISSGDLISYKCMYLEGVFGLTNSGTFEKSERVAICDGLSKAFMCLATMEGIPTYKISGEVSGAGHAWNKVFVNNNWYLVDTTWGNSVENNYSSSVKEEKITYNYLLVSDDSKHVETNYRNYPKTTNTVQYKYAGIRYQNSSSSSWTWTWGRPRWYR